jgi:hypothetical protein
MRVALAMLLVALVAEVAPAAACPLPDPIPGVAATVVGPAGHGWTTVVVYAGPEDVAWEIVEATGYRGDGAQPRDVPFQVRRMPAERYGLVDVAAIDGHVDLTMVAGANLHAVLAVDIGEPTRYFTGWRGRMWRMPDVLEPAAPAWLTPLLAGGVTATIVLMGLGVWVARRRRAIAV